MAHTLDLEVGNVEDVPLAVAIDDDAGTLFEEHGIDFILERDHPYVIDEEAWWTEAAADGRMVFARDADRAAVGLAIYGWLDGEPYLEQLSVRRRAMQRGIGRALLAHVIGWAEVQGGGALWLTTYGHLPFNRAFYQRHGFSVVPPPHRPELALALAEQRRWLPLPDERVAMRRPLASARSPSPSPSPGSGSGPARR